MAFLALFTVLLSGCGPAGVPVVKVTGKVTFEGNPVDGATIVFFPIDPTGREAAGMTDENGEFLVVTQGATKGGCLPGNYRVVITKLIYVDAQGNPVVPSNEPILPYADPNAVPPPMPISRSVIPEKYGNVETSGLTAEVTQRGANSFAFELTN